MGTAGWTRSPAGGWRRGWRRRAGNRGGSRDPQVTDGAGGRGCPFTTEAWTDAAGGHLRAADVRVPLAFGQALHLPHVPPAACRRPRPARTRPDRSRRRRRGRPLPAPHFRPPRAPSASIRRAVERRVFDGRRPQGRLGGGEQAGAGAGGQQGPWAVDAGVSWVPRDPAVGMDTRFPIRPPWTKHPVRAKEADKGDVTTSSTGSTIDRTPRTATLIGHQHGPTKAQRTLQWGWKLCCGMPFIFRT
ncbi:uncharacterized protein [Macaca fascicularis]|uniref:uncharacterized protein n=1 Tax=Macaca fascicularis TaxID=9541 RepID=UPI003D156377